MKNGAVRKVGDLLFGSISLRDLQETITLSKSHKRNFQ